MGKYMPEKDKKKPLPDEPNRAGVFQLFRELYAEKPRYASFDPEYNALQIEHDKLKEQLLNDPRLQALKKKLEDRREAFDDEVERHAKKINRARKHFLAKGLTPEVRKMIEALVDEMDKSNADQSP